MSQPSPHNPGPATAFVFPGQGPQQPGMLQDWKNQPDYPAWAETLKEATGRDLLEEAEAKGAPFLKQNEVVSTLTVFGSCLEWARLQRLGVKPIAVAGYSVGQFAAKAAAGMIDFQTAFEMVWQRALFMNDCEGAKTGAMLAVIGLANDLVENCCKELRDEGKYVAVSNYNALGQLSLAGTQTAIAEAETRLAKCNPRKLVRVEVSGAWHCRLMQDAVGPFEEYAQHIQWSKQHIPVANNVSGEWLPEPGSAFIAELGQHLVSPVKWQSCVQTLISHGAQRIIEVGYGDMLSKFGFFIDRSIKHLPSSRL